MNQEVLAHERRQARVRRRALVEQRRAQRRREERMTVVPAPVGGAA